jgi:hypothetical protein
MTKDKAAAIAKPHLGKEGVVRVFVNQNGLYWINNEVEQMESYFKSKKESYFVFEPEVSETVEKPKKNKK